jgi:hypothetical protein
VAGTVLLRLAKKMNLSIIREFILHISCRGVLRDLIIRALAFNKSSASDDTLRLNRLTGRLQLEWQAREIHSCDRDTSLQRQAELFCEQAIRDTDVAIVNLFQVLPEIEAIAVRVVEPHAAKRTILAGTVIREDVFASQLPSSPRMRLKMLGIRYQIVDGHLEALDEAPGNC